MRRRLRIPAALWVAAGSALGACARWGLGLWLQGGVTIIGLPWGTLAANVAGSGLIGLYAAVTGPQGRLQAPPAQRQFVMAGFCGGFTTFSLFTAELLGALQLGQPGWAALILATSVVAWLLGIWAGHAAGTRLSNRHSHSQKPG
ncbi:MAG: CrcB family protein [Pseudomonadota bacterium]|nr:CrcB family protein [Pseudomonadota bacterium]